MKFRTGLQRAAPLQLFGVHYPELHDPVETGKLLLLRHQLHASAVTGGKLLQQRGQIFVPEAVQKRLQPGEQPAAGSKAVERVPSGQAAVFGQQQRTARCKDAQAFGQGVSSRPGGHLMEQKKSTTVEKLPAL